MTALELIAQAETPATRTTYRIVAVCGDEERHLGMSDADHLEQWLAAQRAVHPGWEIEARPEELRPWITGGTSRPGRQSAGHQRSGEIMTDNYQPGQPQYGPPPELPPFPPPVIAVEQPAKKKPVPQWAVGIAAGVIVLCALCGIGGIAYSLLGSGDDKPAAQTVEATPTVTAEPAVEKPTAEPEEAPDLPDGAMELLYVQVLRDSPYSEFDEFSDDELLAMGELVCDEIDAEGLVERMVRLSLDPEVDANVAGYLTGAAVTALCPEYSDELEGFDQSGG